MTNQNGKTVKTDDNYSIEWYTPPEVFQPLVNAFGKPVLDPASNELANERLIKADHYYTKDDDGLKQTWARHRQPYKFSWVWCNPPFGSDIVKRFVLKAKTSAMPTVILLPSVTERGYFQMAIDKCCGIYFLNRRVTFFRPPKEKDKPELQNQAIVTAESNTVGSCLLFFNFDLSPSYEDSSCLKRILLDTFSDDAMCLPDESLAESGYRCRPMNWHEGHLLLKY